MPQDGSNNYQLPPGTYGVPDTPIESADYNTFLNDLVNNDLNIARPVHRGGTGGTTAALARTNLGVERANQVVTNYDTHVWEAGSFSSAAGATNPPVGGHRFIGFVSVQDSNNIIVNAFDLDSTVAGESYQRTKKDGVWTTGAGWASGFVRRSGDTMTGDLTISKTNPGLVLNANGGQSLLWGDRGGVHRWAVSPGDIVAESGGNSGSNFVIFRYSDAGAFLGTAFTLTRSNGDAIFEGNVTSSKGFFASRLYSLNNSTDGGLASLSTTSAAGNFTLASTNTGANPSLDYNVIMSNTSGTPYNAALMRVIAATNGPGAMNTNFQFYLVKNATFQIAANWTANSFHFGPSGTGNDAITLGLQGGSASGGGGIVAYYRNGAPHWQLGHRSAIFGNNDNAFALWNSNLGEVIGIDHTTGLTTFAKDLGVGAAPTTTIYAFSNANPGGAQIKIENGSSAQISARLILQNDKASSKNYQIISETGGSLLFFDATAGATRMQIDTNGGVNVGNNGSTGVASHFTLTIAGATNLAIRNTTNSIELMNSVDTTQGIIGTFTNHPLRIRANNTNFIEITGGAVIITNSPLTMAAASQPINFSSGGTRQSFINDNTASINVFSNDAGTTGMHIVHGASSWTATSDARALFKADARNINDALPSLEQYALYERSDGKELFVMAQELDKLFPHVVSRGDDDPDYTPTGMNDLRAWGVSYDRLGAIALAYLKQHEARLNQLERNLH